MRAGLGVGMVTGWVCLACSGADVETPQDAPAVPVPEAPVPDADGAQASLLWLADEGGSCTLKTQDLPETEARTLATLGGTCPLAWRIAIPPEGAQYMVYGPDKAWVVTGSTAREVGGTKDGIDMIASDGTDVWACGEPEVKEESDDQGNIKWTLDGKVYETDGADAGAALVRTFKLGDKGWVQDKVAPIPLHEGMRSPWCWTVEGWPEGNVDLSPTLDPTESEWRDATEAEVEGLKSFSEGGWHLSQQGGLAAQTEWFEGVMFLKPVVSRASETAPWQPVPELTDKAGEAHYDVSGPLLLIEQKDKSIVRDVRTGKDVWTFAGPALFWREGADLPTGEEVAEPGEPEGTEPEEGGDPARRPGPRTPRVVPTNPAPKTIPGKAKSKTGKGGKVKAKAPGAAP